MAYLWVRRLFPKGYWRGRWRPVLGTAFRYLGGLWVLVKIIEHYWPPFQDCVPWWVMLLPLVPAIWKHRPVRYIKHRIEGRDVDIEVDVGDVLEMEGAVVMGANSTFDTRTADELISPTSVQGQFTRKYYHKESHLDKDIEESLENRRLSPQEDKGVGKTKRYPVGTVAKITVSGRIAYMVAIAEMNEHGTAQGSWNDLLDGLGGLWHFIGEQGELGIISMPILGTGRARIQEKREKVIREIINSFIAASSERKICEKLVIAVSEEDYIRHQLDLDEIDRYLHHVCKYTNFTNKADTGGGQPSP